MMTFAQNLMQLAPDWVSLPPELIETDPFNRWLTSVTPPPSEAELEYMQELMRTVEGLDLKDDDSTEVLMQKIGSLFKSKD